MTPVLSGGRLCFNRRVRACAWLLLCAGCLGRPLYPCQADAECDLAAQGVCAGGGYCSYPDGACPSGYSYHPHAPPELAGVCVQAEGSSCGAGDCEPDPTCAGPGCGGPTTATTVEVTTTGAGTDESSGTDTSTSTSTSETTDTDGGPGVACDPTPVNLDFYAMHAQVDAPRDALRAVVVRDGEVYAVGQQGPPLDVRALRWTDGANAAAADVKVDRTGNDLARAVAVAEGRVFVGGLLGVGGLDDPEPGGYAFLDGYADADLPTPADAWESPDKAPVGEVTGVFDLAAAEGRVFGVGARAGKLWAFSFAAADGVPPAGEWPAQLVLGFDGVLRAVAVGAAVDGVTPVYLAGEAGTPRQAWFAVATHEEGAGWGGYTNLTDPDLPGWGEFAGDLAVSPDGGRVVVVGAHFVAKVMVDGKEIADTQAWVHVVDAGAHAVVGGDLFDTPTPGGNPGDAAWGAAFTPAGDLVVVGELGAASGAYRTAGFAAVYPAGGPVEPATRELCVIETVPQTNIVAFAAASDAPGEAVVVGVGDDSLQAWRLGPK